MTVRNFRYGAHVHRALSTLTWCVAAAFLTTSCDGGLWGPESGLFTVTAILLSIPLGLTGLAIYVLTTRTNHLAIRLLLGTCTLVMSFIMFGQMISGITAKNPWMSLIYFVFTCLMAAATSVSKKKS